MEPPRSVGFLDAETAKVRKRRPGRDMRAHVLRKLAVLALPVTMALTVVVLVEPLARATPSATASSPAARVFEVSADEVELDVQTGLAVLRGNVVVRLDDFTIKSALLKARYGQQGRVVWARAEEAVQVSWGSVLATAPSVVLQLEERKATFDNGIEIRRGAGWARARQATVELDSHKVTMRGVDGAFPVDGKAN